MWQKYWPEFLSNYANTHEVRFGKIDEWKLTEAKKLLTCGKFGRGFQWHECESCKVVLAVPFSCKSRLCLSCYRKRLFGWSIQLSKVLNPALLHFHVVFTMPGRLSDLLFARRVNPRFLNLLAARVYAKRQRLTAAVDEAFRPGILSTVHLAGNSLNFNPHVHAIATRDLVNPKTGEMREVNFMPYQTIRYDWQRAVCRYLRRRRLISKDEYDFFLRQYPKGFHVYFQRIAGETSDVIFKTAQYIAFGLFHNSQIENVDHERKTLIFRFKSHVDPQSREKTFSSLTMPIDEFFARMLFFLPDRHEKSIRYYGIYVRPAKRAAVEQAAQMSLWAEGIKCSFDTPNPTACPLCEKNMRTYTIFARDALRFEKRLRTQYFLADGYFFLKSTRAPPARS
ncbi:MAG: transposase [Turneriella sp.]